MESWIALVHAAGLGPGAIQDHELRGAMGVRSLGGIEESGLGVKPGCQVDRISRRCIGLNRRAGDCPWNQAPRI